MNDEQQQLKALHEFARSLNFKIESRDIEFVTQLAKEYMDVMRHLHEYAATSDYKEGNHVVQYVTNKAKAYDELKSRHNNFVPVDSIRFAQMDEKQKAEAIKGMVQQNGNVQSVFSLTEGIKQGFNPDDHFIFWVDEVGDIDTMTNC